MKRSLAVGVGAAGTFGLVACGANGDKAAFSSATTAGGTATTTAAAAGAATTARAATGTATTAKAATGTTAGPASGLVPAGKTWAAGHELRVAFTFAAGAEGRGPAKNPYIGVWIENPAGEMVQTVALWIQQGGKGQRYWPELKRWYQQDAGRSTQSVVPTAQTITGATRTAGDYAVAWKGNTFTGVAAAEGPYFLCIEAAREHGPYELIRQELTIGAKAFEQKLTPNGELTAASVSYVVA